MKINCYLFNIDRARQAYDPKVVDKAVASTFKKAGNKAATLVNKLVRSNYNIGQSDLRTGLRVKFTQSLYGGRAAVIYSGPALSMMYFSPEEVRYPRKSRLLRRTFRRADGTLQTEVTRYMSDGTRVKTVNGPNGSYSKFYKSRGAVLKGVSVLIRKDKGRKVVKGAFMAQGQRGKTQMGYSREAFNRSDLKQGRGNVQIFVRKGKERLPIQRKVSVSVAQMVDHSIKGYPTILDTIGQMVTEDLGRVFQHELQYFASKGG